MTMPDFQAMMLPFLLAIKDGKEHLLKDVKDNIAAQFEMSKEDREEMVPSGNQRRFHNRVGWARTHLKHALLIEYASRGVMKITARGLEFLGSNPQALTMKILDDKFPEHYEWLHKKREPKPLVNNAGKTGETPEEQIA